jgi:hypothetical protein
MTREGKGGAPRNPFAGIGDLTCDDVEPSSYGIKIDANTDVLVSARFFLYRNGNMVEYVITCVTTNNKNLRHINWNTV